MGKLVLMDDYEPPRVMHPSRDFRRPLTEEECAAVMQKRAELYRLTRDEEETVRRLNAWLDEQGY